MTPYEIARNIGGAGGKAVEGRIQQDLIGQILNQVGTNPEKAQLGMNQILSQVMPQYQNQPLNALQGLITQQQAQVAQQNKAEEKKQKAVPFLQGLNTVKRMREIAGNKRLGRGSSVIGALGGKTAHDKGEYEQLGKSLISLSTNIPIRNKAEFEALAEKIYDTNITNSERQGMLDAMERILKGSLSQFGVDEPSVTEEAGVVEQGKGKRKDLSAFYVEAKA